MRFISVEGVRLGCGAISANKVTENLSSVPRNHMKMLGMVACTCNSSSGGSESRGRQSSRDFQPANLACLINSNPMRDSVSKTSAWHLRNNWYIYQPYF